MSKQFRCKETNGSVESLEIVWTPSSARCSSEQAWCGCQTLAAMGISVSEAVRMLLVRVAAEKALPFDVRIPNAVTVKAMRAADKGRGNRPKSASALFKELGI